jgi:hypothetical protein
MPRGYIKQYAPFPNVVLEGFPRVRCHIATLAWAGGVPSLTAAQSSQAIAVTDAGPGRAGIAFAPGGTGAFGWVVISTINEATPTGTVANLDSDLTNYATGAIEVNVFADDANTTADDFTGSLTVMIYVVEDPLVTNS